ncbi:MULTISPECIES: HEAT repeat domain-containing protein [Sphingobacterium]|uniref:HEAT repeat domain-containing protein n=1 Tax=Sphingobacterium TaxID=28453 RepID=UPI0013DB664B|nr:MULTISPECIES: HEAT repeat domain-containing protein [unclassified Sphingobacterium]
MSQLITIHELVVVIIVVLLIVLILIISVLIFSFYRYRSLQHRFAWSTIIQQKITEAIVEGAEKMSGDNSFSLHLKEPSFRRFFLSTLVSSEQKFMGKARDEINNLFRVYDLEQEAWRKIRSKRDYLIAGGIQELTVMKVESAVPQIALFLNHPRRQVYQEAQYAIVSFKGFDGLFFLDKLVTPLSDWQQLRLLRSIDTVPDGQMQHIVSWLGNKNETVAVFALRLIGQFQLLSYYPKVLSMLDHESITVRKHTVRILQKLENSYTVSQLISSFGQQQYEVQLEILKALKVAKSKQAEPFLQEQLWQHPNVGIKVAAAEVLMILEGKSYLKDIAESQDTPIQIVHIVKHALQQQIC